MSYCKSSKVKNFIFFDLKISLFLEIRVPPKIKFNNAEALSNKGIKEKPIEMSYHKGSDFNRFFKWRKRWDSNPRTSYPVTAFRVRAVMTTSIHFRIFDAEKPLRSGHNRHAVRIAMTTSIHFLIENIYRVSAWFIIVYKIYFCNKFCTTWLLLLTICGFSMPTMLDGRENRRIIIYHIYY